MNRDTTLAGYVAIAVALVMWQLLAWQSRAHRRPRRPLTFGELIVTLVRWSHVRGLLLAAWLWLGWHLFARVDWR